MAQGVANMVVPFFGGMPVTGTIARTVTNVRAGATTPVAGFSFVAIRHQGAGLPPQMGGSSASN